MKIKLKSEFMYNNSKEKNIKYFKDLGSEEKELFLNLIQDIFEDNFLYGKNKTSTKLPSVLNHESLKNYAIFLNSKFYHYHLGKDFSLNRNITYSYYNASLLVPQTINFLNDQERSGKFKTCENIVNYQMIDEEIIIYNITKHSAWTDIINNVIYQGVPMDYTTCQYCHEVINDNNINCLCFMSPHITTIGTTEIGNISEKVGCEIVRGQRTIEKIIWDNLGSSLKNTQADFIINCQSDIINLRNILFL